MKNVLFLIIIVLLISCGKKEDKYAFLDDVLQEWEIEKLDEINEYDWQEIFSEAKKRGSVLGSEYLWGHAFRLKNWYFVNQEINGVKAANPFVGVLWGIPTIFAFTSEEIAKKWVSGIEESNIKYFVFKVPFPDAISVFLPITNEGVRRIILNPGSFGYWTEIDKLPVMYEVHLKTYGKSNM